MRYLICIKQTPDTAELSKIRPEEAASGQPGAQRVINPWDEYALEAGLRLAETYGGDAGAITVGGESAIEALRSALAMGCKEAALVQEAAADAWGVARLLAAAIQKMGDVNYVFAGQMTVDGNSGTLPVALGRALGWPVLTGVAKVVACSESSITVERVAGQARQTVAASGPAVLSVLKEIGEPRYPTFINIRKAAKVEIPIWRAADLGVAAPESIVHMMNWRKPAASEAKVTLFGGTPEEAANALVEALLKEKVL